MTIDPQKLLELARTRQRQDGIPLSWPTVLQIVEELRRLQRVKRYLATLEEATLPCRFHDRNHEDCLAYSGQVPCEPRPDDSEEITP